MSLRNCDLKRKVCTKRGNVLADMATLSVVLILSFNYFIAVYTLETVEHPEEDKMVLKTDNQQEISIHIGAKQSETGNSKSGIFPRDGEDDEENNNSTNNFHAESTTSDSCKFGSESTCCFQYTWPGYQTKIPEDAANATCEHFRDERNDASIACFDPMVYTLGRGKPTGNLPNMTLLIEDADKNKWSIYCVNSGKSCVSYTYYNTENKAVNQTKFCGVVTDHGDNRIDGGCYRQNVGGYVREVCTCKGNLCNGTTSIHLQSLLLQLTWVLVTLLLATITTNRILS